MEVKQSIKGGSRLVGYRRIQWKKIIKTAWARAAARGEGPKLMEKVNEVHEELHQWDKEVLKRPTLRIKALQKDLERLRRGPMNEAKSATQKEVMIRIELLLEQEEIHWAQRARANWLKHGDRNTSFFQNFASKRKRKNTIKGLADHNGTIQEDGAAMRSIVQDYFAIYLPRSWVSLTQAFWRMCSGV